MTKTIKELYDAGQRQFPMRGGGVSPILLRLEPKITHVGRVKEGRFFANYDGLHEAEWFVSDGCFIWHDDYVDCIASPFDILPIHIPDYQTKHETLVKACEPILKTLSDYEKMLPTGMTMNETNNAVSVKVTDLRNLAAAIRGE